MENIFFDLNKLFCTFTTPDELDTVLSDINRRYTIMYNKIFVLESAQSKELMCTYNIDMGNVSDAPLPNTILLHRKKESNTLYTINALNALIRTLNNGILDTRYIINWADYKNCILLNTGPELRRLDTAIHKIVDFKK
jgi:hypothetical protein